MKNIGNLFVRLFVSSLLTFRYFSIIVSFFGAGAAPFFRLRLRLRPKCVGSGGSGSGSASLVKHRKALVTVRPFYIEELRLKKKRAWKQWYLISSSDQMIIHDSNRQLNDANKTSIVAAMQTANSI